MFGFYFLTFFHYFKIYKEHRIINYRNDQDSEHACVHGVFRGKDRRRDSEGIWDGHEQTAVFEMDNQQGPIV